MKRFLCIFARKIIWQGKWIGNELALIYNEENWVWLFRVWGFDFVYQNFIFFESITISIFSIFGLSTYDAENSESKFSARLSLFVIFICGSVYFYVYNAFLTSALAIPSEYKPFQSPEELLQTSYRYWFWFEFPALSQKPFIKLLVNWGAYKMTS